MRDLHIIKHTLGYGLTDGKKWFFYAYKHMGEAEKVLEKISSQELIKVNICHPGPMKLVE